MLDYTYKTPNKAELRTFAFILSAGVMILFGLLFPWIADRKISLYSWPWGFALVFCLIGIIIPNTLKGLHKAWLKVGLLLGWINTKILLSIVFFALLLPVSLIFKIIRKDPMQRKLDSSLDSYRVESQQPKTENLEKPF